MRGVFACTFFLFILSLFPNIFGLGVTFYNHFHQPVVVYWERFGSDPAANGLHLMEVIEPGKAASVSQNFSPNFSFCNFFFIPTSLRLVFDTSLKWEISQLLRRLISFKSMKKAENLLCILSFLCLHENILNVLFDLMIWYVPFQRRRPSVWPILWLLQFIHSFISSLPFLMPLFCLERLLTISARRPSFGSFSSLSFSSKRYLHFLQHQARQVIHYDEEVLLRREEIETRRRYLNEVQPGVLSLSLSSFFC